jgi:hypothetical protein
LQAEHYPRPLWCGRPVHRGCNQGHGSQRPSTHVSAAMGGLGDAWFDSRTACAAAPRQHLRHVQPNQLERVHCRTGAARRAACTRPLPPGPRREKLTRGGGWGVQAYEWTDGKCIFASGSPFAPVTRTNSAGVQVTHDVSQAVRCHGRGGVPLRRPHCPNGMHGCCFVAQNNMFIFPGMGLGVIASQATKVTDHMLYVAARRLADCVLQEDLAKGKVRSGPPTYASRGTNMHVRVCVVCVCVCMCVCVCVCVCVCAGLPAHCGHPGRVA